MRTATKINNKGFSLVELMIASAIGVVLVLAGAMMLLQFTKANWYARHTSEEWSKVQLAQYVLPRYLGLALDVDWTTGNIGSIGNNRGEIRLFNSGFNASTVALPPNTVAAFLREAGQPSPANPGSDIRATAFYFVEPSFSGPGQLLIASSDQGFGNVTLTSDKPILTFDSIVEMGMTPSGFPSVDGDPVRAVRLEIVFRRFLDPDQRAWQYCPEAEIPRWVQCQTKARFVDETVLLDIPVVNNVLPTDFGVSETLYGNIYFFGMSGGAQ